MVPSKLYAALAAGKPVIYVGGAESECSRLLRQYEAGVAVPAGAVDALVDAVRRLAEGPELRKQMGRNARQLFDARFERGLVVESWKQLLSRDLAGTAMTSSCAR